MEWHLAEAEEAKWQWASWDTLDQLDFIHEWPVALSHLEVLNDYLSACQLDPEQHQRYVALELALKSLQPFLNQVVHS